MAEEVDFQVLLRCVEEDTDKAIRGISAQAIGKQRSVSGPWWGVIRDAFGEELAAKASVLARSEIPNDEWRVELDQTIERARVLLKTTMGRQWIDKTEGAYINEDNRFVGQLTRQRDRAMEDGKLAREERLKAETTKAQSVEASITNSPKARIVLRDTTVQNASTSGTATVNPKPPGILKTLATLGSAALRWVTGRP